MTVQFWHSRHSELALRRCARLWLCNSRRQGLHDLQKLILKISLLTVFRYNLISEFKVFSLAVLRIVIGQKCKGLHSCYVRGCPHYSHNQILPEFRA